MEEFIPIYPEQNDPNIQDIITKKFEFLIKNAKLREPEPIRGKTYNHQDFFKRYMEFTDEIFVLDDPGTGKSCNFINVANYRKKYRSIYRRAFVIEKGKSAKNEMKNEIVYKCSVEGEYETDLVKNAISEISMKSATTKEVKKWISLDTYRSYVKPSFDMTDKQVIDHYSYSIIFLDEAHNLKRGIDNDDEDMDSVYDAFWRIFHLIKGCKIVVASATWLVNDVNELPKMMNLILPKDNQMPLDWDYKKVNFQQLEPFFRGRLTYIRSLDTGAVPFYMGEKIQRVYDIEVPEDDWVAPEYYPGQKQPEPPMKKVKIQSQITCYPTYMKGIQAKSYEKVMTKDEDDNDKQTFWIAARQAASFVYPDGSYGGTFSRLSKDRSKTNMGLGKYVISEKTNSYVTTPELKPYLVNIDKLDTLSCKAAEIIKIEKENTGCSYLYSEFIAGGGIFIFGQIFEANGFERFTNTTSVFETIYENGKKIRRIKPNFKKKKRFVLLTSDTSDSLRDSFMELRHSDENVFGEYLQCLLVSPTGKEAINDRHVVRSIIITAPWTIAGTIQAEFRGIRSTSHVLLIKLEKERLLEKAKNEPDELKKLKLIERANNVKIKVKIYRYVALYEEKESIDLKIYQHSELKNIYIQRIMSFAIRCSIGNIINQERNYRPEDKNYSIECNYLKCPLRKNLPTKLEIDYSTFDIYYSDDVLDNIIKIIENEIIINGYINMNIFINKYKQSNEDKEYDSIEELKLDNLTRFKTKHIYMAVDKILKDNKSIINKFGYLSYFNLYKDILYISEINNILDNTTDYVPGLYSNQLIFVKSIDFNQILNIELNPNYEKIINNLKALKLDNPNSSTLFNVYLNELNLENRVKLLEEALIEYSLFGKEKISKFNSKILKEFSSYVAIVKEPIDDILNGNKKKYIFTGPSTNGETVYLHSLYSSKQNYTKYDVVTNFINANGTIRIYKKSEKKFRDTNKNETPAYNNIVVSQRKQFYDNYFDKFDVFGSRLGDDTFRLILKSDRLTEKEKYKGKLCESFSKPKLIEILFNEKINPPDMEEDIELTDDRRNDIINFLSTKNLNYDFDSMDDKDLYFIYKWNTVKPGKEIMCSCIEEDFKKKDKLMII